MKYAVGSKVKFLRFVDSMGSRYRDYVGRTLVITGISDSGEHPYKIDLEDGYSMAFCASELSPAVTESDLMKLNK